jgi:ribose transport system substrate-binding protein
MSRFFPQRLRFGALAIAALIAVMAVATSASARSTDGVAEAKKLAAEATKVPASIGLTQVLSKRPPKGKNITFLQCSQPVCTAFMAGLKAGAAVLGWKIKSIAFEQTPEGIQAGVQAAIDGKPDGIFFTGISPSFITKQLAEAKAKGIPIVDGFDAAKKFAFPIVSMVGGDRDTTAWARKTADWVIADSNGKANVVIFNISAYTTLNNATNAFKGEMARLCPACKVKVNDAKVTDVGSKLPAATVSGLQRDPGVTYVAFAFGDMMIGVNAALKAAGLDGKAKLVSFGSASPALINDIQSGAAGATSAWSIPLNSWTALDSLARYFVGDKASIQAQPPTPHMVITAANAKAQYKGETNWDFAAPKNYQAAFKKLWRVG